MQWWRKYGIQYAILVVVAYSALLVSKDLVIALISLVIASIVMTLIMIGQMRCQHRQSNIAYNKRYGLDKESLSQKKALGKLTSERFAREHYSDVEIYYLNNRDELRKVKLDVYQQMIGTLPKEDLPKCVLFKASCELWGDGYFLKFLDERNFWEIKDPGEPLKCKYIGLKDLIGESLTLEFDQPIQNILQFASKFKSVRDFEAKKIADWAVPDLLATKKSIGSSERIQRVRIALEKSAAKGIFNGQIINPNDESSIRGECYILP